MAIPTVRSVGTPTFDTDGTVTPIIPDHAANSILVLAAETQNGATIAAPAGGWAEFPDSPKSLQSASAGASIHLSLFWLRAASGAETNPAISTGLVKHVGAVVLAFDGCITTGNPYDVTSGGTQTGSGSLVIAGDTTTVVDCLVAVFVGTTRDADSTADFSAWANADLANVAEQVDKLSSLDTGGGFGIATGEKAAAGAFGNTTVTSVGTGDHAFITVALKPPVAVTADRYDFGTEPVDTKANATMASVTVRAEDSGGTLDTSYTGNVTVELTTPGSATLGGTLTKAAVAGVATFDDLEVDLLGTYTLTATGDLTTTESASFDITADRYDFGQEPSNTVEGVAIAPSVTVRAEDGAGTLDTSYTGNVTVAIGTNPSSGTLSGTLTQAAMAGVATFNDLEIDNVGTGYTLVGSGDLTSTTSATFNITLEAADHLEFGQQPTDTQAAATITPSVTVLARNSEDVTDTNFTADITIAIQTNPAGGTLGGDLTKAAVAGVATFDDLEIDNAGVGYVLRATSTGLTLIDSVQFDITSGAPATDRALMYARRRGR